MTGSTFIAIGGGGATHGTHPELDQLCLKHAGRQRRIGFIGTASGDDPAKFEQFRAGFAAHAGLLSCLPADADRGVAQKWAGQCDLIYLGGGDPVHLRDHLTRTGIGAVLQDAWQRGVTLAGVSAGAMCWFRRFLWRARGDRLCLETGLGLISGTMTPHSLIEPDRRTRLQALVANATLPDALALDDGAALVFHDAQLTQVFPPKGPPHAYRFTTDATETCLNG